MIEAGQTVDGYRVVRMIGRGGMGVVYEAVQTSVKRNVALKVLRPELAHDPEFLERFRREARLQASLEHPNVLEVYDVGESDAGLYLAMRLVSGRTLLDLLRDGELDATRTLTVLDQVTGALDAAHEASLIHRDVKPQNVLMGEGDQAYLADFGLTRAGTDTTIASTAPMLGSVAYVAPEIVRGEEPTPASDRYSVAATLFHCLTGDVVFPRGSDAAVLYAHAAEDPPRVHERRAELPPALDPVMEAALAKRPEDRPPTARAIVGAAREALGAGAGSLGPPRMGTPVERVAAEPPPPQGTRRRVPSAAVWACGLLVAAVVGAGAALALDGDDSSAETAAVQEVPVPPVPEGAQPLGSDLAVPERAVGCRGEAPVPNGLPCAVVQTELPGATLLAPSDGLIVGWAVRGASGDLALDVIRPRGADTLRVVRSQFETAGNAGSHYFKTQLPVEAGDQIGIELGPNAAIGVSEVAGAATQRWRDPSGGAFGEPTFGSGTGFDYELALRADFVPGAKLEQPKRLTGAAAANAIEGFVRQTKKLKVEAPQPAELELQLVEVEGKVALDVFRGDTRTQRVFIPGLRPLGVPVRLEVYRYPGEPYGEASVFWVNRSTGRMLFHGFIVGERTMEFIQ